MASVSFEKVPHDTPTPVAVPVRLLTLDGSTELVAAMEEVQVEGKTAAAYQEEAAALNTQSNSAPSDIPLIRRLNRANGKVVAASSRDIAAYPGEVAVLAAMPVANIETGLGRIAHLQDDRGMALAHYEAALELVKQIRAYSRISNIDGAVYGVSSRATAAAGELAADRRQSIQAFLTRVDENIIKRYSSLMANGDLSGPAAFGGVAMLRRALQRRDDVGYLEHLRHEAPRLHQALRPTDQKAAKRFQIELSAILEELDVVLGKRKRRGWEW